MSLFTSKREKRLWLWAIAVILAIYLTLPLTPLLAKQLRNLGLDASLFGIGFLLILLGIVAQGLKIKPSGLELGILIGIIGAYMIVFVRITILEERSHVIEYSVVAFLIYEALLERNLLAQKVPFPAIFAILISTTIGVVDEFIQRYLPNRVFDYMDILFNFLASLMAVMGVGLLRWAKRIRKASH